MAILSFSFICPHSPVSAAFAAAATAFTSGSLPRATFEIISAVAGL
ncbi:MAG: hypothetical protein U5K55_00775 [Aliarcobacter sp.]|nr:hypothetical protein [Aliarcobacter sp.]